MRGLTRLHRE